MISFLAILVASFTLGSASPVESKVALDKRDPGTATPYNVGLGACGDYNVDTDPVVAISTTFFGSGSTSSLCNQGITITNTENGVTVHGVESDHCYLCGAWDLELSQSLFLQLAPSSDAGEVPVTWSFDA
ncbi:hypothetical protein EIP91_004401 [Steccherinum ochraceum]|uniref:RlpA-like protein double-psi beta-barrel domain-containing protein n=1 Tax=Steccherinum ochraceum TaxID=92696 RepID=A0A4R0RN56_9APHY|nr:hypothetical protein EIP91_004401 [Steccherinum ochraceum]